MHRCLKVFAQSFVVFRCPLRAFARRTKAPAQANKFTVNDPIEQEVSKEIEQQLKQGKTEAEVFNDLVSFDKSKIASSTHRMKLDVGRDISADVKPRTVNAADEVRISEEYEKMMEVEFSDFSDKEEFLRDRAERIVRLKKQYEEYDKSKKDLDEFARKGKQDLGKTKENKLKDLARNSTFKTDMEMLGFRVNWHPLNEKVAKQVLEIAKSWDLDTRQAKHWFYVIRREEIKTKKALEILYSLLVKP
eukprot:TRINITY_DN3814_c0_g8_i2.p1 TRINITY_DN3814_c0_g8~~TRINITY_DN3814_c0_g8_i2.p1  ORF type:complete len:247 (+),score=79.02 TRINITY_DN3814_c0_g8_i2:122-862(+)